MKPSAWFNLGWCVAALAMILAHIFPGFWVSNGIVIGMWFVSMVALVWIENKTIH